MITNDANLKATFRCSMAWGNARAKIIPTIKGRIIKAISWATIFVADRYIKAGSNVDEPDMTFSQNGMLTRQSRVPTAVIVAESDTLQRAR